MIPIKQVFQMVHSWWKLFGACPWCWNEHWQLQLNSPFTTCQRPKGSDLTVVYEQDTDGPSGHIQYSTKLSNIYNQWPYKCNTKLKKQYTLPSWDTDTAIKIHWEAIYWILRLLTSMKQEEESCSPANIASSSFSFESLLILSKAFNVSYIQILST